MAYEYGPSLICIASCGRRMEERATSRPPFAMGVVFWVSAFSAWHCAHAAGPVYSLSSAVPLVGHHPAASRRSSVEDCAAVSGVEDGLAECRVWAKASGAASATANVKRGPRHLANLAFPGNTAGILARSVATARSFFQ